MELSQLMIDQLRDKVDEATIPLVVGDTATARGPAGLMRDAVAGCFSL